MKLLPIPGLPGYRIDCENQVAYEMKYGVLKPLKERTKYKVVNVSSSGYSTATTIYRMMYCAQHGIDITKIPPGTYIGMRHGVVLVTNRDEMNQNRHTPKKTRERNLEQWRRNTDLINRYYAGDTEPLLDELKDIEQRVKHHFVWTYGLCEERAEIVAAYGVNRYLDKLTEGFPSPCIIGSVIRYARGENSRLAKQRHYDDNMKPIEL
jgi:hypothetical protein